MTDSNGSAPEIAASMGTARFLSEITTAAGLSHPNIVPLHDSGERDGVLDPNHPVMLYNLACFRSVAGRVDIAIDHVERALDLGFLHKEWYLTDSDLANVRDLPRFQQLIAEKFGTD